MVNNHLNCDKIPFADNKWRSRNSDLLRPHLSVFRMLVMIKFKGNSISAKIPNHFKVSPAFPGQL